MELSERISWLVLGMAIGFVLGYIVARLRDIKEEVDEIDEIVKQTQRVAPKRVRRERDEDRFFRLPRGSDLAYLVALLLILSGLWFSNEQRNQLKETTACNTEYLKSQAAFLSVILEEPPVPDEDRQVALQEYFDLLTAYSNADERPTPEALAKYDISDKFKACLETDAEKE